MTKLIEQLVGEEGEVLSTYNDHLGYATIGVGRLIDKRKGGGITQEESRYLLANDIKKCKESVQKALPFFKDLNEPRQAVLIGMAFQMGIAGLLEFKNTLDMVKRCQYKDAGDGMLKSLWARQTPERAHRMANK